MRTVVVVAVLMSATAQAVIPYPGDNLTEVAWIVPNHLTPHCWKGNVVPYMIVGHNGNDLYGPEYRNVIESSVDVFNSFTCLKYVNVEEKEIDSKEYLVFNITRGGWCNIKQLRNLTAGIKYLVLTLHVNCLRQRVQHMMMHSLGFLHEHQRSDRDCYVEVYKSEIDEDKYQIVPQPRWEEWYPYDKYSVMHYRTSWRLHSLIVIPRKYVRKTPTKNIITKDDYREALGNEWGILTKMDVNKIRFKFCNGPHYCDTEPRMCHIAQDIKIKRNCTSWRFTNSSQILPPDPLLNVGQF